MSFVIEMESFMTWRQLCYSCRRRVFRELSCIFNKAHYTELCSYYLLWMFVPTRISCNVGKRYDASDQCSSRHCHILFTVLFQRQQMLRNTCIKEETIVRPSTFAYRHCTDVRLTKDHAALLNSQWNHADHSILNSSCGSSCTSTSWKQLRCTREQCCNGIRRLFWNSKNSWWNDEEKWHTPWIDNCTDGNVVGVFLTPYPLWARISSSFATNLSRHVNLVISGYIAFRGKNLSCIDLS